MLSRLSVSIIWKDAVAFGNPYCFSAFHFYTIDSTNLNYTRSYTVFEVLF